MQIGKSSSKTNCTIRKRIKLKELKIKVYKVYRYLKDIEKPIKNQELVAVEYGKDIYDVMDRLIEVINDNALGLEKYQKGYEAATSTPGNINICDGEFYFTAILMPKSGALNELIDYGVIEENE